MEQNSNTETKSDLDEDQTASAATGKIPPPYGSKEYWDQRYEKLLVVTNNQQEKNGNNGGKGGVDDENGDNNDNDEPVAFHSWYFSYDDLKPIILPLILGGKEEARRLCGESKNDDADNDDDDEDGNEENKLNSKKSIPHIQKKSTENKHDTVPAKSLVGDVCRGNNEGEHDNGEGDEGGWEEVEGGEISESEEETSQTETGIVVEGPISVLEVGCGDVPLVVGLAEDLRVLTSKEDKRFVDRIVCTDYSATLIQTLERIHRKKRKLPGSSSVGDSASKVEATRNDNPGETNAAEIEYMVADARDLPFPDQSFHLILEKGTMDAMISDSEVGVTNCIGIVSDCARVLATGGKKLLAYKSKFSLARQAPQLRMFNESLLFRLLFSCVPYQCPHLQR